MAPNDEPGGTAKDERIAALEAALAERDARIAEQAAKVEALTKQVEVLTELLNRNSNRATRQGDGIHTRATGSQKKAL